MLQRKFLILLSFASFIVILDQGTKMYIHTHFFLGESVEVIKNFFNLTYVRNTGAAFGLFHDSHKIFRMIFFLSMPPLALIIVVSLLKNVKENDYALILALSGIAGGAVGNLIDRLRFGFVIDFLDFYIKKYAWPAFNVADIAIVLGMSMLFLAMFKDSLPQKKSDKKERKKS